MDRVLENLRFSYFRNFVKCSQIFWTMENLFLGMGIKKTDFYGNQPITINNCNDIIIKSVKVSAATEIIFVFIFEYSAHKNAHNFF